MLRAQAVIAVREGDVAKATRLSREADDIATGGFVPLEKQIARIDEDIQRKLATHGDAYRNSDAGFVGKGMAEDILNRNRLKTEAANLSGTTPASVNQAYNNIYATAKRNLGIKNPKLRMALEALDEIDTSDSAQLGKLFKLLDESGVNAQQEFEKAISEAVKVNKDQAIAQGWNTKSIELAAARFQGLNYEAISSSTEQVEGAGTSGVTTGSDQTDAALGGDTGAGETGVTNVALGSQVDPVPEDVTVDKVSAVDRGEDVNVIQLNDDQIADLQTDYPNDASGAAKWLSDSLRAGSNYGVMFDEAARIYKGSEATKFQDTIQMLVQNADDALEATGGVSTAFGKTTVGPNSIKEATQTLMQNLNIDQATATRLIDIAVDNLNRPLSSRFMTDENVRRTLVRKNNLTSSLFSDRPRILNRKNAVEQISEKFLLPESQSTKILNSAYPITSDDIEKMVKDAAEDSGQDFDVAEAAAQQFAGRDDVPTGEEAAGRDNKPYISPGKKGFFDAQMRNVSNVALISAYLTNDMSDLERNEIRRRLETDPSFVDQLAAYIAKVNKAKKGPDSKLTPEQLKKLRARTSKQQVPMARGGLMRR